MTATVSYTPAIDHLPSSPSLRMPSALTGSVPALQEGAWWYHSCYPGAELPRATALLDPQTTRVSASWLMAAVSDPLRTSTAGPLMEEAARLRTVTAAERAVEVVWDAEGGREAPGPASRPRIPAVTAPVLTIPAAALPTPHPAKGM
ncbi:hypothetical protein [Streptomyces sp. TLI_185]|uniref:hypothetical protein n=1 Tax=Streptomyces sp. TLI_185 TaxID=2485151 RepID=UPI000F4EE58D|nr:hypothetical protein [Streptomyces sp. TLI_185]RPF36430.1 hypothetical protein EDD92_6469 [Streptomyces sp. TLI_185]